MCSSDLDINVVRLLSQFHAGSLTMASTWREMLAPATADEVLALAAEAGALATAVGERLGLDRPGSESPPVAAMTEAAASFMFPDELWSRILYDLIVGARDVPDAVDARVASLVPVYFGRVASFVIENRELTTDRAEAAAAFMFPDDLWARVVYDLIAGARVAPDAVDTRVAALVPVYFGRVASLVIENRELSTDRAEAHVERQAREFERLKPYLVARWDETGGAPADPAP